MTAAHKSAAGRMTDLGLADATDDLRYLIHAAWMAAEALNDPDDMEAIRGILSAAEHKLAGIKGELAQRLQPAGAA